MLWRVILVSALTVIVFLVTGIFVSSPQFMLGGMTGLWVVLAAGILMAGSVAMLRQQREKKKLKNKLNKWETDAQGKIWRGY